MIRKRLTLAAGLSVLAALPAGCGGSGGYSTQTIGGTLTDQNGTPLAGYRVLFDNNAQLSATTNARGQFVVSVPVADYTGHDSEYIYDPKGDLADVESVPVTDNGLSVYRVTLPAQGPPTPPLSGL